MLTPHQTGLPNRRRGRTSQAGRRCYRFPIRFLLLSLILAAGIALGSLVFSPFPLGQGAQGAVAWAVDGPAGSSSELLQEIRDIILKEYVIPVNPGQLNQDTPRALVASLGDPYSQYLSAAEFQQFINSVENSFGGVGMQVELKDDFVTVVAPLKNTPAARAGVRSGDRVLKVDGREVAGLPLEGVVNLIKGEPGSQVTLELGRGRGDGGWDSLVLVLTRELIRIQEVESRMLPPGETGGKEQGIGYIGLNTFSSEAAAKLTSALVGLREKGLRGLVLDLRNNGGGYLDAAHDVASALLAKGQVAVEVVDRAENREVLTSLGPGLDLPLVVLVNGGTASAAEIVAGAVQDHRAGVLVGSKTFGKASVQSLIPLSDGGALKLTTAHYLTPAGRQINGQGLEPDVRLGEQEDALARAVAEAEDLLAQREGRVAGAGAGQPEQGESGPGKGGLEDQPADQPAAAAASGWPPPTLEVRFWPGSGQARLNGSDQALPAAPYVVNGVTMVPLRWVAENLGWSVTWLPESQRAAVRSDQGEIASFDVGRSVARFRGQEVDLLQAPVLAGGVTFVPVRPLSQFLGAGLAWDPATGEVVLSLGEKM